MLERLTFLIKTFERPICLRRLLQSISRIYPGQKVVIVDDSSIASLKSEEIKNYNLEIDYIRTEFNIGLSKGRNIGLKAIQTDYFLLLDDDFVLDAFSNIENALSLAFQYNIDILGGQVVDIKADDDSISVREFSGFFEKINDNLFCKTILGGSKFIKCDFVLNFFIAKVDKVNKVLWDTDLYLLEHLDFFYRAKQKKLSVFFLKTFFTFHQPEITDIYLKYRSGSNHIYSQLLHEKLKVKSIYLNNKKILG